MNYNTIKNEILFVIYVYLVFYFYHIVNYYWYDRHMSNSIWQEKQAHRYFYETFPILVFCVITIEHNGIKCKVKIMTLKIICC